MESIVLESQSSVLVDNDSTNYVNHSSTETAVVDNNSTVFVTLTNKETVLLETNSNHLVITGMMGPAGKSEEEMVYSKRIDFVTDDLIYKAEASAGTLDTAVGWRIRKVVIGPDGDVSETWASGNTNFDKVWSNRLTYTYS